MNDNDYFFIAQDFMPLDSEFVGKDLFGSPDAIEQFFLTHFSVSSSLWYEDQVSLGSDNWYLALMKKKKYE